MIKIRGFLSFGICFDVGPPRSRTCVNACFLFTLNNKLTSAMAVNEAQNEAQRIFFRREFIVVPFLIFNHQMVLIN